MHKWNRWVAENAWLVYIISAYVIVQATVVISAFSQIPPLLWYILMVVLLYICVNWVFGRSNVLLSEAMQPLWNTCDPYPMVEEARLQLRYPGPKNMTLVRQCNFALALQYAGEYEEALEILTQMPIHKTFGIHAQFKTVYYNNLMALYVERNQLDKAVEAYDQMLHHYGKIKISKQRAALQHSLDAKKTLFHFCRQEYAMALSTPFPEPKNLLEQVLKAKIYARIYLAMGDLEQAKEKLEFIVQHGNRLYVVTEAKALLDSITTTSEEQ